MWQLLDNPAIWEFSRFGLDLAFGLYRKRIDLMQKWEVLKNNPSVLDIGCGIGQYASVSGGPFLGVDLNERYIEYARKRHRRPNQSFRCSNVTTVLEDTTTFDLVLVVDFLHHLSDAQCLSVLTTVLRLVRHDVVSFEPITDQPHPIGRWIVEHDRGDYVRPLDKLHDLVKGAGLTLVESTQLWIGPINTRAMLCRPPRSGGV